MTNNKQQTAVKLYTEKEINKFIQKNVILDELTLSLLTSIELPSDEEIKKESKYKSNYILPQAVQFNPILNIVWIEGAIWMRDKIQGGNK
jgi:hypothetical protein